MNPSLAIGNPESEIRLRRWRLLLGGDECDGIGFSLGGADLAMDRALQALYDSDRQGNLGSSAPNVARWLGDIRTYFPTSVVHVMQQDTLERLDLRQMLMKPELLESVEPDVHLVTTLISLSGVIPGKAKETARMVVRRGVEELERELANPTQQVVIGSLNRSARNRRPRYNEID